MIGAARRGRAVEIPVAGLDETGHRDGAVRRRGPERIEDRIDAAGRELEDRAGAVGAAAGGGAVERAVLALDQRSDRPEPVRPGGAEGMEDALIAAGRHLEDGAAEMIDVGAPIVAAG